MGFKGNKLWVPMALFRNMTAEHQLSKRTAVEAVRCFRMRGRRNLNQRIVSSCDERIHIIYSYLYVIN